MKSILLLLLLAVSGYPAIGQVNIGRQSAVLEDKTGNMTILQVSDPAITHRFTPSQQSILHFGFTNSFYWLRFTVDNRGADSLLLQLKHAFVPDAELYYEEFGPTGISNWIATRSGFRVPLDQKPVMDADQVFPLPRGSHVYYLRIRPYVHAFPLLVREKKDFEVQSARQKMIYGIYAGLLLFAIAINLFLFFSFRKSYYGYYAVLVFLYILSSALVMEGYAVYFFPRIDLMFWYRLVPVLDMPALIIYCLAFLEVKKYDPRLYNFSLYCCITLLPYILALPFLPLMPVLVLNQLLALGVFILAIVIGLRTGKRGNRLGYYFVTAYSIWFVLINMELIYIQTGRPPHIGEMSYVSIAIFIEAFLLAYLQVRRFQWEKEADQRQQEAMQQRINRMQQEYQQEILNSRQEMQEETFLQISQEIHDNIGQILSLAKLHLATMDSPGNTVLQSKIRETKNLVAKAIHDLRTLSHRLNTDYVTDLGLYDAVRREVDIIARSGAYQTSYRLDGVPCRFDAQKELVLFRIVQELLNNILKHARAKVISVVLNYRPDSLYVTIADDGQGFDPEAIAIPTREETGLGIRSMNHRAGLIGADFQLTSTVGEGTVATIHIPFSSVTAHHHQLHLAENHPL